MTEPHAVQEYNERLRKLQELEQYGTKVYPDTYNKTHSAADVLAFATDSKHLCELEDLKEKKPTTYSLAGRIKLFRTMGKLSFLHILDESGTIQIALMQDVLGKEAYDLAIKKFDLGDFIGIEGDIFLTKHGEPTVLASTYTFLGKALLPLPDKFHGLKDPELVYRKRYLDLIANEETMKRFQFRSQFIKALREFYWSKGFTEVETPILATTASGALATPFVTHHKALDIDVFLRIAPETYLKECIIGGFEKIFEIGRVFRNEGIDPSHLQDFTMVEHYAAYWNYEDNIAFTEEMFLYILEKMNLPKVLPIKDREGTVHMVDFTPPWPRVTLQELILKDSGIDIFAHNTVEALRATIIEAGIVIEKMHVLSHGNLIDHLYKKVSRPKLISPVFITKHPLSLSPLARKNDSDPSVVDRFQLVIGTWEVNNAYSELVDPLDQKKRFEDQAASHAAGDEDAHAKDDEYVEAMEYGMPPISGYGMGIDRIVTLLTGQDNLRDVVLFPLMRPKE